MNSSQLPALTGDLPSYIAGVPVESSNVVEVFDPYSGQRVGSVANVTPAQLEQAIVAADASSPALTRYDRQQILETARQLVASRAEEFAQLIRWETGLCMRETRYEVGRAQDVLQFSAMEALRDDGQIFSCDLTAHGKQRKIFTVREPLQLVAAITPFNHPLNQVVHKLGPALAAGVPVILKPSEKTPLTAIRFAELLYEAGLPGSMLSVLLGPIDEVVRPLVQDPRVELVSFTGSVAVGKEIAETAGYKKLCLELGGNSPLIVLADADLELAVNLAVQGCFRNSGQRCTAVKRILVQREIAKPFTEALVAQAKDFVCGDPSSEETMIGTVIDEAAAQYLETVIQEAVAAGAQVLCGGERQGAQLQPTVLSGVPRDARMVVHESFGPLAPVMEIADLSDAIQLANSTAYGLSAGVVTRDLEAASRAIRELRTGTVNVNEVPGYRIESSPFGGIKDSGLGVKEGVIEAVKWMTYTKTFSLPW